MTSGWYLTNDKAVIMIAHRLKTVQKAERIFVLENGKPYSSAKKDRESLLCRLL